MMFEPASGRLGSNLQPGELILIDHFPYPHVFLGFVEREMLGGRRVRYKTFMLCWDPDKGKPVDISTDVSLRRYKESPEVSDAL